ncbi:MAG: head completion/stabilization protein [Salinisphaeraceae bacterium]
MSLVAYDNTADPAPADTIPNNTFWPALDPADFRAVSRLDQSVSNGRVDECLAIAMVDINRILAAFQAEQVEAGHTTVDDIPLDVWQTADHYPRLYRRAVYALAHAGLMERYRDHSATGDGDERGQTKDEAADDLRADARWAVAEITGGNHSTVELI